MEKEMKIITISAVAFLILLIISFFIDDFAVSSNLVFIGVGILIVPYSLYKFFELKAIRSYEEKFPSFLMDLAESQRSGLSTIQAIHMAAKSDYGNLTEEIKKMDNQLSWNIPLTAVLNNFGKRMKKSKVISRSLMIIDQANKSGGNIDDAMDSLASNMEANKEMQEEKNTLMSQQVMMMYAIFFIFLGISIALIAFLIPMLQTGLETPSETAVGLPGVGMFSSNPCHRCTVEKTAECIGCDVFFTISAAFGFGEQEDPASYYKALFFAMILVQGFFSGLIIGQIGSESIVAGIKHSIILLLVGAFVFMFVIKLGLI